MGAATADARAADDVAEALTARGPARRCTLPDVAVPIWGKLALAVMSPISSVLRMTVAGVWATPDGPGTGGADVRRGRRRRRCPGGCASTGTQAWAHARQVFAGTGEHYTSMCTDVMKGRPTELAAMAGAVHELATSAGVPVPVHATVLSMLRAQGVVGA